MLSRERLRNSLARRPEERKLVYGSVTVEGSECLRHSEEAETW